MNDKTGIDVFKSKRFWSALVGLVFMVASAMIPSLEQHAEQLINSILIVISLLIGGYSAQDAINASKTPQSSTNLPSETE